MRLLVCSLSMLLCGCTYSAARATSPRSHNPFASLSSDEWAAGLDAMFLWSNGISLMLIAVCIAIIIFAPMPSLKMWAWVGLVTSAILLGCGIVFAVIKPLIPWLVLGSLAAAFVVGVWYIVIHWSTIKQLVNKDSSDLTKSAQKIVEAAACQNLNQTKI